jgi:endonuclease YncB( thermonuclease family)
MRSILLACCAYALATFAAACADDADRPEPTAPGTTHTARATTGPAITCAAPYPTGTPTAATVFCVDPALLERAPVVRIVDGDTIRVQVGGVEEPVRFYGIDTPERGDRCFDEATERTRQLSADEVLLRG